MFEIFCVVALLVLLAVAGLTLSAVAGLATWSQMLQRQVSILQMTVDHEASQRADDVDHNDTLHAVTRRYIGGLIRDRLFPALNIPKDTPKPAYLRAFEAKVKADWKAETEQAVEVAKL